MKTTILQAHNEKRNFIAGGGHAYLKPACRMATMQWDEELASMAALNVRQCRMKHDKCRNTDTFRYVGQNLGWQPFSGNPDYNNLFQHIMSKWYAEGSYTRMDDIDYYEGG